MRFFKKRERNIDLEGLYASAEWPCRYDVTIHLDGDTPIHWGNVDDANLAILTNVASSGKGSITISGSDNSNKVTIPANKIVCFESQEIELQMWNEDKL